MIKSFTREANYILWLVCLVSSSHFHVLYGQQWKEIRQFIPAQTLQKIRFIKPGVGMTVGTLYNGSTFNIHGTTDGGKTWQDYSSGYTATRFMDIDYVEDSLIYMSGNEGLVIRSWDGGKTWQTLQTGTKEQLWGIHFTSRKIGFAVGSNGCIMRTQNGGNDWEKIETGISNLLYSVIFTPDGKGFASGSNVLLKSDNGGDSWEPVASFPFEAPADWIRSIHFVNQNIGYACADIGRIYKTIDGGNQWEKLASGIQDPLFDIDFIDENIGMVCGFNGVILSTRDGGQSWQKLQSPLGTEHNYSLELVSEHEGYICTHFGKILSLQQSSNTGEYIWRDISIYPNPVENNLTIRFHLPTNEVLSHYVILDMQGRIVSESRLQVYNNEVSIHVNDLATGNYIVNFYDTFNRIRTSKQIFKQ